MTLRDGTHRTRRNSKWESTVLGTPSHERAMLMELANDLERWPARNAVFREALDRAAHEIAELANGAPRSM
jgi:hypothetical protein